MTVHSSATGTCDVDHAALLGVAVRRSSCATVAASPTTTSTLPAALTMALSASVPLKRTSAARWVTVVGRTKLSSGTSSSRRTLGRCDARVRQRRTARPCHLEAVLNAGKAGLLTVASDDSHGKLALVAKVPTHTGARNPAVTSDGTVCQRGSI